MKISLSEGKKKMAPTSFSKAEGECKGGACRLEGKDAPTEKKKKKSLV